MYEELDDVGVSYEARKRETEYASTQEIVMNLAERQISPHSYQSYIFGSQSECSKVPGIDSDIDITVIPNNIRVVANVDNCPDSNGLLLVPDIKPGYAKLQAIVKGQPVTIRNTYLIKRMPQLTDPYFIVIFDKFDRFCVARHWFQLRDFESRRQGPVLDSHGSPRQPRGDLVFAFKCDTLPECAREWLTRDRQHGWPSAEVIEKCQSLGSLLVPAGHPDSDEPELNWRHAFCQQELILVRDFNSVQMKCFVLLKFVNKHFIRSQMNVETLTSYHCKTCMFYCIENTPAELWMPEKLTSCLLMCFRQLKEWVFNDNCPNYFIPGENMFERIGNTLKKHLLFILDSILSYDYVLDNIHNKMLRLGSQMREHVKSKQLIDYDLKEITTDQMIKSDKADLKQYINDLHATLHMVRLLLSEISSRFVIMSKCLDNQERSVDVDKLQNMITELEQATKVTTHTEEQSKKVISLILPYLQLIQLSLRVVEALEKEKYNLQEILYSNKWAALDIATGSAKLKQASAMLMNGCADMCMGKLMFYRRRKKYPICFCYDDLPPPTETPYIITGVSHQRRDTMMRKLLDNLYQPCVIFLPNEYRIAPVAINYEMIRSYGRSTHQEYGFRLQFRYNWGVVDGIFLIHFLIYLNAKVLGQKFLATRAIKDMILICNIMRPWHLDTSYNLLGWVFKDRGDVTRAVECFRKSMRLEPMLNAAYWHLCFFNLWILNTS